MIKYIFIILLTSTFVNPTYAGVDQVFGEKKSWWKNYYNSFLSSLGIEKSYALVVGISHYEDNSFQSLPSEKDAVRMKNYLVNEAGFDHVRLITGDKVTIDKIRKLMFDDYPKFLTSKDRFLFYWSGHGVSVGDSRKQGFLAVQDSQEDHVSTMVSMSELTHWDRRFNAKQTLYLLDACFSGIAAATPMSTHRNQTIERVSRPSSQVLVAGLANEETIAIEDINGGVFTRALLDGLRGRADTNKGVFKKDGVVTAHELVEYVREHVDHERRRVGWPSSITPRLATLPRRHKQGDFFFVADKRMLKPVQNLKKERRTKVIATGVQTSTQQGNRIPPTNNRSFPVRTKTFENESTGEVIRVTLSESIVEKLGSKAYKRLSVETLKTIRKNKNFKEKCVNYINGSFRNISATSNDIVVSLGDCKSSKEIKLIKNIMTRKKLSSGSLETTLLSTMQEM